MTKKKRRKTIIKRAKVQRVRKLWRKYTPEAMEVYRDQLFYEQVAREMEQISLRGQG